MEPDKTGYLPPGFRRKVEQPSPEPPEPPVLRGPGGFPVRSREQLEAEQRHKAAQAATDAARAARRRAEEEAIAAARVARIPLEEEQEVFRKIAELEAFGCAPYRLGNKLYVPPWTPINNQQIKRAVLVLRQHAEQALRQALVREPPSCSGENCCVHASGHRLN